MKNLGIFCAALVVVAATASTVSAADAISKSTLANMGLGSMQVMSDNDGLAIRGMGYGGGTYAAVWGSSTADYQGQTSNNGYEASANHSHGSASAQGNNLSVAGTVQLKYSSHGLYVRANLGVAGGFSSASAH